MKKEKKDEKEHSYPRELPKVKIGKKIYYRDDRLREFRNVDNPHDYISY